MTGAIQAIGRCAREIPESTEHCLGLLMNMIKSSFGSLPAPLFLILPLISTSDIVISNAVLVLKSLYQSQFGLRAVGGAPPAHDNIVSRLARRFPDIRHPSARASVLWLVGQYASLPADQPSKIPDIPGIVDWAPDILRLSAKSFATEVAVLFVRH